MQVVITQFNRVNHALQRKQPLIIECQIPKAFTVYDQAQNITNGKVVAGKKVFVFIEKA